MDMSPHTAMIQPAPAATRSSRTLKVKPLGAPLAAGSLLQGGGGVGVVEARCGREATSWLGNGRHVQQIKLHLQHARCSPSQCVHKHAPGQHTSPRSSREGVLRLGHADGQAAKALPRVRLQRSLRLQEGCGAQSQGWDMDKANDGFGDKRPWLNYLQPAARQHTRLWAELHGCRAIHLGGNRLNLLLPIN